MLAATFLLAGACSAQNPIVRNQYSADPSARVFGDKVYLFPSHDILAQEGKGRVGWFCMEDYHVFSSADLSEWTDHGMIVTQNQVPWVRKDNYAMWAPDCIERNGKYYFYFPTMPADTIKYGRGFAIGVAIADKPEGPYTPVATPIEGVHGIDPNVFIDTDGQAYLYWSAGNIYGAKLKENMTELASEVKTLGELPSKGLKEGPYMFARNGNYYLTYPHVENKIERLEYAMSSSPLGPFKVTGVIMDESQSNCWTNHHSIINFKGQHYLFYHDRDFSPRFDKARSVRCDSLFFNEDGTIRKVIPTLRGVGITKAGSMIQPDRYTAKSGDGITIAALDTNNYFKGWKTGFNKARAWIQYNTVDFGAKGVKKVTASLKTAAGNELEIHLGSPTGALLAVIKGKTAGEWKTVTAPVKNSAKGIQHIVIVAKNDNPAELDWIQFSK